ncbi:MAG: EamA family transporter RarD [Acidobacteria bacterium]|nr:EamA family transporter RarD [Acidobacteriota bacterium]
MDYQELTRGRILAVFTYLLWGLLPIYWKIMKSVPAGEILLHRMFWSFLFVMLLLSIRGNWKWLHHLLHSRKTIFTFLLSAVLLSGNWLTFIWAINNGYLVESSLGYFLNPLISVLLGMIFLKERLNRWQATAVLIAACGMTYLTISYGHIPWIGLILAFSFGFYGLIRKTASLNSLEGFATETGFMFLPSMTLIIFLEISGKASFLHTGLTINIALILAGSITSIPLLTFAAAARRIPLSNLGILQYITPTMHFLLGVLVYGEIFTHERQVGFSLVWIALIIYTLNMITQSKKSKTLK